MYVLFIKDTVRMQQFQKPRNGSPNRYDITLIQVITQLKEAINGV